MFELIKGASWAKLWVEHSRQRTAKSFRRSKSVRGQWVELREEAGGPIIAAGKPWKDPGVTLSVDSKNLLEMKTCL
jgi:hypothetical protein